MLGGYLKLSNDKPTGGRNESIIEHSKFGMK